MNTRFNQSEPLVLSIHNGFDVYPMPMFIAMETNDIHALATWYTNTLGFAEMYERNELMRLQRILFHRELGVPLNEIAELLALESQDRIGVLKQHREKLATERERYRILIQTIDRTIGELEGTTIMSNADLYRGFSPEKQAGYESWLIERYGEPMSNGITRSTAEFAKLSPAAKNEFLESMGEKLFEIESALANFLRQQVDPASDAIDQLIARHRAWVSGMWHRPCSVNAYAGLADLYLAHPDFVARYEKIEPGFAEYLAKAMKLHADKHAE